MAVPSSQFQLGELTLSPNTDTLFQLGELLARTNAAGGLLQPLRLNQVGLTLPVGQWAFKKAEYVIPGAFTPDRAAQQFVEFADEALRAILGGYARLAYHWLDPTYPGFTDSLLAQLLPGRAVVVPKPRPIPFDMVAVLQAYGTTLEPKAAEPLQFAAPRSPATPPSEEDLLLTALVLFVEELNLTAWLAHVAACEPTRRLTQVLGGLARGEFFTSNWGGLLPKLLSWVVPRKTVKAQVASSSPLVLVTLDVLTAAYAEPGRLAELYAKRAAFRTVRAALDHLPPDDPNSALVQTTLLTGLLDGLHALATQAAAKGQTGASIRFAHSALLAIQLVPASDAPAQVETWLAHLQAQEHTYQWSRLTPDQPLDQELVWSFSSYAGAARIVASVWSKMAGTWYSQGRVPNQFWTASWFGLERLRLSLRLFYALSQQEPLPVGVVRQRAALTLKHLLDHYRQAQQDLALMLARNLRPGQELSQWVQLLFDEELVPVSAQQVGDELRALEPVEEALRLHGYGPALITQLGKLVASLVPVVLEGPPVILPVPSDDLPSTYEAEEDRVYQQVLAALLHQAYVAEGGRIQQADGTPLIPSPATPLQGAELTAYHETWLAQHPTAFARSGVLNLWPKLRSMRDCLAEYRSLLNQSNWPARSQVLQQLASELEVAALARRPFAPVPAPEVGSYTCYWRYAPFQQYPQPTGSQGSQLGLRLSRVGFNAARDTGFFFYDLDYGSHIIGGVALVRKQASYWVLQTDS